MGIELGAIKKAVHTLREAIELHETQKTDLRLRLALRDAVIQRFEYTYELASKLMRRWVSENIGPGAADPVYTQRELFRVAARWGLIEDPLRWFEYHKARNVAAHTYNEINADIAFTAAIGFVEDAAALAEKMEKRDD